jgi:DNA invertase Pin-like site-specific DNA recombinase
MRWCGATGKLVPMIAAYIRVSSKGQSLAMQRHAIGRVATQRGHKVTRWYAERVSTRNERPELVRLRSDIRGGRVQTLYVYRLDRLTRGTICEAMNLLEEFRQNGCTVETIADGFSMLGPAADIVAAVLTWAANMERAAIAERVASARARVEASGGSWGRPRRLTERQVAQVRVMHDKQHRTIRSIAQAIKVSRATVQRALARKPTPKRSVKRPTKNPTSAVD